MVLRGLRLAGVISDQVVATCDSDLSRARLFAESHAAPLATTDPHEAIAACDTAWICTPTSSHLDLVSEAAACGVAVYCEKPLAPRLAEAEQLAEIARSAGLPVQVGLVLRHSPALGAIADLIASAELGRPFAAILRDDQYFPIQGQYGSEWRADVSVAGGGTLIEHSIHDLDLLCWLLGPADEVSGGVSNFAGHPGIEDVAIVELGHASGTRSSLTSVWHSILTRPSTRRLEVFCERGLIWTEDEHAGPVTVHTDMSVRELPLRFSSDDKATAQAVAAELSLPEQLSRPLTSYILADKGFLDALRDRRSPHPGLEEALEAHRNIEAAYQSARRRDDHQRRPSEWL